MSLLESEKATSPAVHMSAGPPSPAPLPDNDDMLREILLRLTPLPSSFPRASLVWKRWRRLLSDPHFLRRFRAHHRTPPLLGFFVASGISPSPSSSPFLGCRHGLALLFDRSMLQAVVWDPVAGRQCCIAFPPELLPKDRHDVYHGAVLSATVDDGAELGHGDCHIRPFKLVLVCDRDTHASASLYESQSAQWGNITTTDIPPGSCLFYPSVLVGNALCWLLREDGAILEFDLDTQSLAVSHPEGNEFSIACVLIFRTEDNELGLAILSKRCLQLWRREASSHGATRWVLRKNVELDKLLSRGPSTVKLPRTILGFDEDSNVIFLYLNGDVFMIQLQSMQFIHLFESNCIETYYPYTSFFTSGWGIGGVDDGPKILNNA
ncbi:hypothetical protein ACP70R_034525 [Stipagrostis hirtigluma subsp. patula]